MAPKLQHCNTPSLTPLTSIGTYNVLLSHNKPYRYIVEDRFHDGPKASGHKRYLYDLCPQLTTYKSVTSEVINSKMQQSTKQYLLFYTTDLWTTFTAQLLQPNNFTVWYPRREVIRDNLHRFVYERCQHTQLIFYFVTTLTHVYPIPSPTLYQCPLLIFYF